MPPSEPHRAAMLKKERGGFSIHIHSRPKKRKVVLGMRFRDGEAAELFKFPGVLGCHYKSFHGIAISFVPSVHMRRISTVNPSSSFLATG